MNSQHIEIEEVTKEIGVRSHIARTEIHHVLTLITCAMCDLTPIPACAGMTE